MSKLSNMLLSLVTKFVESFPNLEDQLAWGLKTKRKRINFFGSPEKSKSRRKSGKEEIVEDDFTEDEEEEEQMQEDKPSDRESESDDEIDISDTNNLVDFALILCIFYLEINWNKIHLIGFLKSIEVYLGVRVNFAISLRIEGTTIRFFVFIIIYFFKN